MAKTTGHPVEQEPLDRLEEKVKLLVAMLGRMRTEQARTAEEQARLTRDLEAARARIAEMERGNTEALALKEERDVVRTRVSEMLEQLEALNL